MDEKKVEMVALTPGEWSALVAPIAGKFELAAVLDSTTAEWSGPGAAAMARLLRHMALLLDNARMAPGKKQPGAVEPTVARAAIEAMREPAAAQTTVEDVERLRVERDEAASRYAAECRTLEQLRDELAARPGVEEVERLRAELADIKAKIADPVAVGVNMRRGTIAKPADLYWHHEMRAELAARPTVEDVERLRTTLGDAKHSIAFVISMLSPGMSDIRSELVEHQAMIDAALTASDGAKSEGA